MAANGVGLVELDQLEKLGDNDGQPAISAGPEGLGKVVSALGKGPAVEKETSLGVEEVLQVYEKLLLSLGDVVWSDRKSVV